MASSSATPEVAMDSEHELGAVTQGAQCNSHYSFIWTDLHLPRTHTDPLRHKYDELGQAALDRLQEIIQAQHKQLRNAGKAIPQTDLLTTLMKNYNTDPVLSNLWREVNCVPSWVDWQQLQRAQKYFYRYAAANIVGFALQGFFGENSASTGVTEVLARTGGFKTAVLLKRLMETFQWLLQVTDTLKSIQPGGTAWKSTIRVRLLHCSVRGRILKMSKTRPDYFDLAEHGIPANVLDSVHSITTFACLPIFSQLPQLGIKPGKQETADYIALFRYLSYLLGTPDEYVATPEQARATMESMMAHEVHTPTETSRDLGANLMAAVEDLPPFNVSRQFLEAGARVFNGDAFCDGLGLGRPAWHSYAAWKTFCWILVALAKLQQVCPPLDRYVVKTFHDFLINLVIKSKYGLNGGTDFAFKYVPEGQTKVERERSVRVFSPGLIKRPFEVALVMIYLLSLFFAIVAGPLLVSWCAFSLVRHGGLV